MWFGKVQGDDDFPRGDLTSTSGELQNDDDNDDCYRV